MHAFRLCTHSPRRRSPLRQRPRLRTNDFSFTVGPKVRNHADNVVQARICALVDEQCAKGAQRVHDKAGFDGAVETGACEQGQRPFPGESDSAEDEVDDLEDGEGLDCRVEVFGEKVPEDFGPEEGFDCSRYLIYSIIH
jgi:hypothetical protein